MPASIQFHQQETAYSCGPACLRMVLEYFGVVKDEEELRTLSDCTSLGTWALNLVNAGKKLGFVNSAKYNLELNELASLIDDGLLPIVYLRTAVGSNGPMQEHSVVVTEINDKEVSFMDPLEGDVKLQSLDFEKRWRSMRGLTIVIDRDRS